jgi:cytochrome c oxidase subunit 2
LSAIIVVSLIAWTYGTLLYVEQDSPVDGEADHLTVDVVGYQFGWTFTYENGHESATLRVPADTAVKLRVSSRDVFHNFGIPALKVKSDAIPGQQTDTWFVAEEPGEYTARCYELCGTSHSYMTATVVVMPKAEYEAWYANTTADGENASSLGAPPAAVEVTA